MSVSRAMRRLNIDSFSPESSHNDGFFKSLDAVFQMGIMKQASGNDEPLALAELMKFGDDTGVFDPHDRIYGLIGLATPEARNKIPINYSDKSPTGWSKTYLQCAKVCIQDDPSLSILFMLSNRPKGLLLPSWCPNFNANQRRPVVFSERSNAGILRFVQLEDGLPKAWVEEEKDILFAPGCQIDLVKEIVSSTFTSGVDCSDPKAWKPIGVSNLAWER